MKKITKAMSLALSAAMALSSFAAMSITAGAAGETISLDTNKTFDAVRLTFDTALTKDETLTVDGTEYKVAAGTASTVVSLDSEATVDSISLTDYSVWEPSIELLAYERIALTSYDDASASGWSASSATKPYLAASWQYTDDENWRYRDDVKASRYTNLFNDEYETACGLYFDGYSEVRLSFDFINTTEIAKARIYYSASAAQADTLRLGVPAKKLKDKSSYDLIDTSQYNSIVSYDAISAYPTATINNTKEYVIDIPVNITNDMLMLTLSDDNKPESNPDADYIYEIEFYTYKSVATVGTESLEKIIDLKEQDSTFNRVVLTNAPSDVTVSYSDDNGETWLNIDKSADAESGVSGIVNTDGVIGYMYGGYNTAMTAGTGGNHCTYAAYTADKIKIASATADVSKVGVAVYNAVDTAPTSNELLADNSKLSAKTADGTELFTQKIFDSGDHRLNNPTQSNPAYVYNVKQESDGTYTKLYEAPYSNTEAYITLKLDKATNISQVGIGNIFSGLSAAQTAIGSKVTVEYKSGSDWIQWAEYNPGTANHVIINGEETPATDEVRFIITFGTNNNNISQDDTHIQCIGLSYIGVYDFGENLAASDKPSAAVDLGKIVNFNKLTTEVSATWQYSADGNTWSTYTNGEEAAARFIRIITDERGTATPAFSLSWEGNLLQYAAENKNGASASANLYAESDNVGSWADMYDGAAASGKYAALDATDTKGDLVLSFNGNAVINSIHGYYDSGCWYPKSYTVQTSNKGEIWAEKASEVFELRLDENNYHPKGYHYNENGELVSGDGPEHSERFNAETAVNADAAMLKIAFRESMRSYCENSSAVAIRILELAIDGSVALASYDGETVTFPDIPDDVQIPEPAPAAAKNTFVANITSDDDASITKGTNATAVLSEIDPGDYTVKKITWTYGAKTAAYDGTAEGNTTITDGAALFALILDWSATGDGNIPDDFSGLTAGDAIAGTVISTVIE